MRKFYVPKYNDNKYYYRSHHHIIWVDPLSPGKHNKQRAGSRKSCLLLVSRAKRSDSLKSRGMPITVGSKQTEKLFSSFV